jgi:hypothetical protein
MSPSITLTGIPAVTVIAQTLAGAAGSVDELPVAISTAQIAAADASKMADMTVLGATGVLRNCRYLGDGVAASGIIGLAMP